MTIYENKNDTYSFEKTICFERLELWKNEASNLFSSARVLLEFSELQRNDVFTKEKKLSEIFSPDISNKMFWHYRIIRMLWGYGFENILKAIIIQNMKTKDPSIIEVPVKKIQSHDLKKMFNDAGFTLEEPEQFYIGIVEKCSVWMGRYPLPINPNQMYEQRKSMSSKEELFKRQSDLFDKYHKGEIPRTFCESDVLHGGITAEEKDVIANLIQKTLQKFSELNLIK